MIGWTGFRADACMIFQTFEATSTIRVVTNFTRREVDMEKKNNVWNYFENTIFNESKANKRCLTCGIPIK